MTVRKESAILILIDRFIEIMLCKIAYFSLLLAFKKKHAARFSQTHAIEMSANAQEIWRNIL